jgi:phage shock protein PspC (stress-responsive transcriptional regulator)
MKRSSLSGEKARRIVGVIGGLAFSGDSYLV